LRILEDGCRFVAFVVVVGIVVVGIVDGVEDEDDGKENTRFCCRMAWTAGCCFGRCGSCSDVDDLEDIVCSAIYIVCYNCL